MRFPNAPSPGHSASIRALAIVLLALSVLTTSVASDTTRHEPVSSQAGSAGAKAQPRWPVVAGALGVVVILVASRIRRLQVENAKDRGRSRAETK